MEKIGDPYMGSSMPSMTEDRELSAKLSKRQEIKKIIARLDSLPSIPAVAAKILTLLSQKEPDLDEIAKLIETDQAVALKLMRMVNSASSGARISSLSRAIFILGTSQIRFALLSLTISDSLIKPLRGSSTEQQKASWKHCLASAVCAEMLAEIAYPDFKAEAFLAGLVHDVGKLILEESVPDKWQEVVSAHSDRRLPWIEAEQEILKIDHTIVGKWLAEKWNLPEIIVEAIWLHHHPLDSISELEFVKHREIISLVHLGSRLAHSIMADNGASWSSEPSYREITDFLHIEPKDLEKVLISIGKRYEERAAIMELDGEDEVSFYFNGLQRANRKLAKMAAESGRAMELEKVVQDMQYLHELQLDLIPIEDSQEVLLHLSKTLLERFAVEEGIVYYLDRAVGRLMGIMWTVERPAESFSVDLDGDSLPVRTSRILFNDTLDKLLKSYNTRFLRVSSGNRHLKMLQYYKPYLIIPMAAGGDFIGEIILLQDHPRKSSTLSKMDLKTYGYLASVAATSLVRIRLKDREKEAAESLSKALLKNSLTTSQLKQAREMFEYLFEYSNDAILLHQMNGDISRANQRAIELLGYTGRELCSMSLLHMLSPPDSKAKSDLLQMQWRQEDGGRIEAQLQTKDRQSLEIEISSRIVDDGPGMVQSILRDITNQKEAALALAAEKERLAVTLRSIGEGVVATDGAGRIVLINRFAEELTGHTEKEAMGNPFHEIFCVTDTKTGKCHGSLLDRVFKSGEVIELSGNTSIITRDRIERNIAASCAPIRDREGKVIGAIVVFRDMTEKIRMEREVLKVQKLESISNLAGGIAHDFNNILSAIVGNISLAKMFLEGGASEKVLDRLENASIASMRAKDLTNQLLTFSEGGAPVKKIASITQVIKDSANFVMSGSNSKCEFHIAQDLWPVDADVGQISRVINNLVINGRQAMPNGGTIRVRAENFTSCDKTGAVAYPGNYVKITVEDEGTGIPEENLHHIFEPYFTTKPTGYGLGLATCHSIVKNHGGYISVDSKEGAGTAFSVFLPASCGPADGEKQADEGFPTLGGKILVMDDEQSIREVIGMMLEHSGCEVLFAQDGIEAIALYREAQESGKPFDTLIIDLTIPAGMGGKETLERLLEIDPEVRAIASSGYSKDPIIADFKKYGFKGAISKPFRIEELEEVMRSCCKRRI